MLKQLINNNKGMSLVGVLMAMGLAGVLAVVIAQISKNSTDVSIRAFSSQEELELLNEIKMIISDPKYCKISLVDNIPFKKINIDGAPSTEGLDIELWLSDINGTARTVKKFNGENNPGSNDKSIYGKIIIKSIKLVMNNTTGINYPDSPSHSDIGQIKVQISKKNSSKTSMDKNLRPINIRVNMASSGGNSTILSCSQSTTAESTKMVQVWASDATWGRGASGDTSSTYTCPDGYGLSAFNAKTGNDWDSVQFQCSSITTSYSNKSQSTRYGGTGGAGPGFTSSYCKCPNSGFVKSIYMFTGSDTDGLGGDCVNTDFVGVGSFAKCGSKQGGNPSSGHSICPPKSFATGVLVRHSTSKVNTVKLLCSQKSEVVDW